MPPFSFNPSKLTILCADSGLSKKQKSFIRLPNPFLFSEYLCAFIEFCLYFIQNINIYFCYLFL